MAAAAPTTPGASVEGTTDHGSANKRLRDEQDGSDPSDENSEDMYQASFTVVSYKKKSGTGVLVVFRPTTDRGSLWKVNPNTVTSSVVTSAQEKVLKHRLNKDGSLMVTVSTLPAANRLLTVTELASVPVDARVTYSYTANYAKIQDVSLSYSNEDLPDYLHNQGVVSARSPTTCTPDDGGKLKEALFLRQLKIGIEDDFYKSGVGSIPVALVPSSGGFIRLNNPKAIQVGLQAMTPHFQLISDVRQFGRGGLVCRSSDPSCVSDILKCKTFASVPLLRTPVAPVDNYGACDLNCVCVRRNAVMGHGDADMPQGVIVALSTSSGGVAAKGQGK
ncbi:hypothetical protein HPB51_017890 [Rhipicephalus microplus]|uniref:Uncharacterized protein n=1 Tax=Rhipicephalus microplus TaxID=6941 RepID=A0A9J6F7Y1_RHIMP|nr:hypothetical protein HPB51_017890 [Rhipicephalus microplus]